MKESEIIKEKDKEWKELNSWEEKEEPEKVEKERMKEIWKEDKTIEKVKPRKEETPEEIK